MRQKFISQQYPDKYAYAFDSDAWDMKATVSDKFRMFETFGDVKPFENGLYGITQHSPDWPITGEFMADYLTSLAVAMLADVIPPDMERSERRDTLTSAVSYMMLRAPSVVDIEFAASVVFKETDGDYNKRRYYSLQQKKVSSAPAKEHDKRYQEVARWNDGTPEAILRMLSPEFTREFERYQIADAIREWTLGQTKIYCPLTANFLKWTDDRDAATKYHQAFHACRDLSRAYQLRCSAESDLCSIKRDAERAKAQRAEENKTPAFLVDTLEPPQTDTAEPISAESQTEVPEPV